ncbi:phosphoribosyltransferase family protein [Bacillaceae bacterium CLA-AA-H227]|uniref:Phosphoribosyltransferase family protein n=1 Tax=Robertmurraya yapensis (ex Hitch et al 2024) TaxID=3133160 RepID=A0ACC6SBW3_9BACI
MSKRCLFCYEEITLSTNWSSFFTSPTETYLCRTCRSQLIEIEGETCDICSRSLEKLDPQYVINKRCLDCVRWEQDDEWKGYLLKNKSLYEYNDFLKEIISQYKFRGDYILAKIFSNRIQQKLPPDALLVPIPLSSERQFERGFNQSEALIFEAGHSPIHLLERTHTEKQSKKSRHDRIHIPQVFQMKEGKDVANKDILLIDDIYTTGSTLRHAAKILMQSGAKSVSSLTLARS